jgi:hypothetical protein
MINKNRLERLIHGVIEDFRKAKRIPDQTADDLATVLDAQVDDLFQNEGTFSYRDVDDSASYISQLRDDAQSQSAELFLQEIVAWQQMRSS